MLVHDPLDVLGDDDRVVDHDADRQHEPEQRDQVDREAQREHASERRDQRHEDGDRADERRAEALQEQVDDQHDEHDRLDQRVDHLLDRQPDEVVGVERHDVVDSLREPRLHVGERLAHRFRHGEAVRAGLQVDGEERRRRAVELRLDDVLAQSHFGPRDVTQTDDRAAVLARLEDDVLVLPRVDERRLRHDGKRELHRAGGRLLADLTRAEQRVLLLHGAGDVGRRDAERGHPVRVHPDPHRLVRDAHHLRLPGAGHALQRVQHVHVGEVGDVVGGVALALCEHSDQHHDRRRFLLHRDAELGHCGRQLGQREVDAVLHLHLCDVGIGVEREVDGQRELAVGGGGRHHVEHVVDAVDLRLDWRRHRIGERLRVGAGVRRRHGDLDRRDRRILLDRQHHHRDEAGDAEDDRDDRGEDRPLDEEPREHGSPALSDRPRARRAAPARRCRCR